jgi:selenocysteine lyase/cysteine desulfurase
VYDAARILHRHGALACFDYAASAPYVEIDMNRDAESCFDAVFFSPHKFLGGPGASGVLLFNRRIYRCELPPTFPSGGTVDYVGYTGQDYTADIETREKPGTPGTIQILRTMLAMQVKQAVGQAVIEEREQQYLRTTLARFARHPGIEILGNPDPALRIGIVSFNIKDGDRYLHPKLATRLLNDLFGIQSRAGCSCAGPYGHRLLDIGRELSDRYRDVIRGGCQGIKPGWVRICLHYSMEPEDVAYLCEAVEFLAEHGGKFLPLYRFDIDSGAWTHVDEDESQPGLPECGLSGALAPAEETEARELDARPLYREAFAEAEALVARLDAGSPGQTVTLPGIESSLVYFRAVHLETRAPGG